MLSNQSKQSQNKNNNTTDKTNITAQNNIPQVTPLSNAMPQQQAGKPITPQMDAEQIKEAKKAEINAILLEANRLIAEDKPTQELKEVFDKLNTIRRNTIKYPEKDFLSELKKVDSKISDINKLEIKNQIQSLIVQVNKDIYDNEREKASGNLSTIDAKLNREPSLKDCFSKTLGNLHFNAARIWSATNRKKMGYHLGESENFDNNQIISNYLTQFRQGNNPFSGQNFVQNLSGYELHRNAMENS